jgi:hypothetical protein
MGGISDTSNKTDQSSQSPGILTPDQIRQYYSSEGSKSNPMSPLDWLKAQQGGNTPSVLPLDSQNDPQDGQTPEQQIEALNQQLASYQANQSVKDEEVEVRGSTQMINDLKTEAPVEPTAPKLATTYEDYRTKYNVEPLEKEITDIDAKIADIEAGFREQTGEDRFISKGFRTTANKKLAEDATFQIDALNRQKNVAVNQLNNKYNTINMMMGFEKYDYETARSKYEFDYNKNLTMIQLLQTDEEREADKEDNAMTTAKATLGTMSDMISEALKNGSISSYDDLDTNTKLQIQKLEMQAGLPVGFYSQVLSTMAPDEKVLTTQLSEDKTTASIIIQNSDGTFTVKNVSTGLSAGSGNGGTETDAYNWLNDLIDINPDATYEDILTTFKSEKGNLLSDTEINNYLESKGIKTKEKTEEEKEFLNEDYFKTLYGDGLKKAAKDAGFGAWNKSSETEIKEYLTSLMNLVSQYRLAGYTDKEILKMMQ